MSRVGAVYLAVGLVLGVSIAFPLVNANRAREVEKAREKLRETARVKANLIRAAALMRGVAQGVVMIRRRDPTWRLPDNELELIEVLIAEQLITRELIDEWPGSANRPSDEPPFYIVRALENLDTAGGETPLLHEHPAHHPEGGGTIVFTNGTTEMLEPEEFRARIAWLAAE